MSETSDVFWDYSLKIWENENAKQLLLEYQEQQGLDINLLLFLLWISGQGMILTASPEQVSAIQTGWLDKIIKPIRALRRENQNISELKSRLLQAELEAERHYQKALCALLEEGAATMAPTNCDRTATIKQNFMSFIKLDWDNEVIALMSKVSP